MKILFSRPLTDVQISFILLDWSCRESFHIFDYLDKQDIARDQYELVWLEYYDRCPEEISQRICSGTASPDIWAIMEMPVGAYYHKHFIYNAGILLARGKIVVICDSDAMVEPTFVRRILDEFEQDEKIVLHLDEVRNIDRCHYPFDYPSVESFLSGNCINWQQGLTSGLLEGADTIHDRNYGACFCALKEDLIAVGGADEHIDYLGHVCGPYDLTFRLINAGRREMWLKDEFLYHTWHPGTDGKDNYLGPHDGRNISIRSLNTMLTGRVLPYQESPAIARYKETGNIDIALAKLEEVAQECTGGPWRMDDVKRMLSGGREAWYRGRYREAVRFWEPLCNMPETCTSETLAWLGWGYLKLKSIKKSITCFKEALKQDKTNSWAQCGLARALSAAGEYDAAHAQLCTILEGPAEDLVTRLDALECRVGLMWKAGGFEVARNDLLELCELYGRFSRQKVRYAAFRLGMCELHLNNPDAARTAFVTAGGPENLNVYLLAWSLKGKFFGRRLGGKGLSCLRHIKHIAKKLIKR